MRGRDCWGGGWGGWVFWGWEGRGRFWDGFGDGFVLLSLGGVLWTGKAVVSGGFLPRHGL